MKLIKNIFIKLIWLILILLVAFNIYNFISINVLKKDIASINGYAVLEVVSGSMEPTIKIGDIIVINTKARNYNAGDIITFYDVNGSFVTHRLVSIGDGMMITKGDANDSKDEEMDSKNIVGKYVTKISGAGKLIASLKNPFVMLLIMVIGIVLCLLMSTDDNLIPKDLTDEEKAYLEYKKYYRNKNSKAKEKHKKQEEVKIEERPEIVIEEAEVIGEITYVSVEELEEQEKITQNLREQLKEELRKELKEELRREIQQENQVKQKKKNKNKKKNNNQNHNNNQHSINNNKKKKHQHRKNKTLGYNGNKNQTRK